jgi:putative transcriptional regulator
MNRKHFGEMLASVSEAVEIARGELAPARAYTLTEPDVRSIRRSLGLTQAAFAALLDVPVATIQGYEQGRRVPDAPARSLLRVAQAAPDLLRKLFTPREAPVEPQRRRAPVTTRARAAAARAPAPRSVSRRRGSPSGPPRSR